VHGLVRQLGTRAMNENDPVCRHWRDLQVMASHLDVSWDRWMLAYGDHVLSAVPSHEGRAP
jgi:3-hydroxy-9,10-secoandrosta-1,3,5(10)-triene-9,17-dione monooxygenase